MDVVLLSVIIPTKRRDTLTRTFDSAASQLGVGDEIMVSRSNAPWGGRARNDMMARAKGTHLTFMDDDDRYAPGAFEMIRTGVRQAPQRVHIFKMRYPDGNSLWTYRRAEVGNVGTPMIVVPNVPEQLGTWGNQYEGDFQFLRQTLEKNGLNPVFHEDVIALIRH